MANLSKERRDRMIQFLEQLKEEHSDDASIRAFNEIENHLREKKYGLVWEEHSEEVDELLKENIPILSADPERRLCKDENLPWNFIIEGDNLQALYLLEKTHRGKVDCIYIDPPYNTGAKDWKYNNDYVVKEDAYRHSKWLSMMKSRLDLAKHLLNPRKSVLIVTIDEKEYLHLGCLLEEMFPEANIQMITDVINPRGTNRENEFSRVEEYIFVCRFGEESINKSDNNMLGNTDEVAKARAWFGFNRGNNLRASANGQFYPIYIDEGKKRIIEIGEPLPLGTPPEDFPKIPGLTAVFPINDRGNESIWRAIPSTAREWVKKGYVKVSQFEKKNNRWTLSYIPSGLQARIESGEIVVDGKKEDGSLNIKQVDSTDKKVSPRSVWFQKYHNATDYGATVIKDIIPNHSFSYPKSLYAVHDTLWFFIANKPNALVIDFFAGSGTTFHAVNLLNAEDGGHRKCILVTNNEVSDAEAKEMRARNLKPGDEEWESLGIARYVTWPRSVCAINGINIHGEPLKGNYIGSDIPMANGFQANVKYFRCDWTPRRPEDYLLSNVLCLHIKEMIELQNAIEVDNVKHVLLLNKEDYRRFVLDPIIFPQIEDIWVNQNILFSAEEMRTLQAKGFKYIPREFFGQELREAAE
ncbi:MAG: site-specific DNA-methyltransferase [Clostridia bacterium]|nr:site-specific DNA-methyltransferase [Clostridia bacterium]